MGCRCLRKQTVSLFAQQQCKYNKISEIKHKSQQLFVFYLREYFLFATFRGVLILYYFKKYIINNYLALYF